MSEGIETTTDGAILEVRLNRPKANAIDLAASRRLNDIFSAFRDDPKIEKIIRALQKQIAQDSYQLSVLDQVPEA